MADRRRSLAVVADRILPAVGLSEGIEVFTENLRIVVLARAGGYGVADAGNADHSVAVYVLDDKPGVRCVVRRCRGERGG